MRQATVLHWQCPALESAALHPGRSASGNLLALAQSNGIPARRVNEVLKIVGLSDVARRLCGTFSLGMTQRLGIAGALLGDPGTLVLDKRPTASCTWTRRVTGGESARRC